MPKPKAINRKKLVAFVLPIIRKMEDTRYWVSKVLTPEQKTTQKKK